METTQTVSAIDIARERLDFQIELLTAIEEEARQLGGIDDFNPFGIGLWIYDEPHDLREMSPELRRAAALGWLHQHAKLVQRVARRMGHHGSILKAGTDMGFGVQVRVDGDSVYIYEDLIARVPADLTCEMVEVGEEVVPAVPEHVRPILERRCPKSIFDGIESEVTA